MTRIAESNSKLIGQVMKFDPSGPARRPPMDTIQNIRKLNSEYKLGQLLCKCRNPDLLLSLIKRQNSKLSLPWLSSLIESNSNDCLEIMPIQCICEFVWNVLSGTVEEVMLKKQINIEQLLHRIKIILSSNEPTDSLLCQQIKDTFDYFLNKLCSEKQTIRNGALKIFNKLFIFQLPGQIQTQSDLNELIEIFKNLPAFDSCIKPLLIKYFRRALMVETNPQYLSLYLNFIFEQLLNDYASQNELESSLKMELEAISIKNESTYKTSYNEISMDLADFFFKRNYYLNSLTLLNTNESSNSNGSNNQVELKKFRNFLTKFTMLLMKMNEYNLEDENVETEAIKLLVKNKQIFDRKHLDINSYILIELNHPISSQYLYINEKIFNLVIYFFILVLQITKTLGNTESNAMQMDVETNSLKEENNEKSHGDTSIIDLEFDLNFKNLSEMLVSSDFNFTKRKYLNCKFGNALNEVVQNKILRLDLNFSNDSSSFAVKNDLETYFECSASSNSLNNQKILRNREKLCRIRLVEWLIDSLPTDDLFLLVDHLFNRHGISPLSTYLIIKKIEFNSSIELLEQQIDKLAISNMQDISKKNMCQVIESYLSKYKKDLNNEKIVGEKLLEALKKSAPYLNGNTHKKFEIFSFDTTVKLTQNESLDRSKFQNENASPTIRFNKIKEKFNEMKTSRNKRKLSESMEVIENGGDENSKELGEKKLKTNHEILKSKTNSIICLIDESSNQNLEMNLNKMLNQITSVNECILALTEAILIYENKKINLNNSTPHLSRSFSRNTKISKNRCIIDILLDYLCHFDPQIVNKEFMIEYRLLFELRGGILSEASANSKLSSKSQLTTSAITQSFLLSLFIHQANWEKLYKCVQFLFNNHLFFSKTEQNY
jgi:hypothetical protein